VINDPPLHIVLYQPDIPQNTGNVGRTCLAVGAHLWLVRPLGFHVDEKHLRRAGLDYWQHVQCEVVDDWETLRARLPNRRYWYYSKGGATVYSEVRFEPGDVLVFGSESSGLPPSLLQQHADQTLRLPIRPPVRSLNLASTVAVAVYEAMRQFGLP
jgi:tRNA (cytidine/uridine-2'-O-)-methyltransferase